MDKSEILVHISAPSGVVDDARYRAQVEAILNFQSYSRETITISTAQHAEAVETDSKNTELGDATSRNSSPVPLHPVATRDGSQKDRDSLETPVSVIPDSQPDLEQPGLSADSASLSLLPLPVPETPYASAYIPAKRPRLDSPPPVTHYGQEDGQVQCDNTPIAGSRQVISTHMSPTKSTNPAVIAEKEKVAGGQLGPTKPPVEHAQHDDHGAQSDNTPIPTTGDCEVIPTQASPTTIIDTPVVPEGQRKKENSGKQRPESEPVAEPEARPNDSESPTAFLSLPLEIKPPPPPISQSPFTTHITPTLEMLTDRLKSPRTYNPKVQTRDLDVLERGYWYLDINLVPETSATVPDSHPSRTYWDKPLFTRFWTFLSDFIAKEGRAGWGVWCILEDRNHNAVKTGTSTSTENAQFGAQALSLKVYAWGEIACQIYLLLFLASERRIRKMGAQWRDGSDEVVIQMPGASI
ncbi:uncharacterized protein DSM5745_07257 [Aspergillus mulundensis]|uniref:Acetamidase n=1 Tax=Aspergillus mulundensis TaxID=1810919 RepID=A0A3D8RKM3_9EURO|nr:hypothetical protein DSM5745_07257 [Aspergillus mulundensis]RDW74595.1 hypothetical protein DSM5745_07257 [Aspergillus mulundensis]